MLQCQKLEYEYALSNLLVQKVDTQPPQPGQKNKKKKKKWKRKKIKQWIKIYGNVNYRNNILSSVWII